MASATPSGAMAGVRNPAHPSQGGPTTPRPRPRRLWFWAGCALVLVGVALHLPMLAMAADMRFRLAGMAMDPGMYWGMAAIVVGVPIAGYGLVPAGPVAGPTVGARSAPEPTRLVAAHWALMLVLTVALVVDVMKPASLGFVVPGMMREYGLGAQTAAWVPLSALAGTVTGSYLWGAMSDVLGRRSSIVLSAVTFVGTSICGAMPSFGWNVGMCFLMGAAAGGMLPVAYALLAETMPAAHRGWSLVLVGGLGGVGGYLAASWCSSALQPSYGWRAMWLLNVPTGALLILLNGAIPESPAFLSMTGRMEEARRIADRFGAQARGGDGARTGRNRGASRKVPHPLLRTTLGVTAFAWGLVNFGLLLWIPADLAAMGHDVRSTATILAHSAMLALPTVLLAAPLYALASRKTALIGAIGVDVAGICGVILLSAGAIADPTWPVALLIVGSNASLAMLLPYTAEAFPVAIRGRATGSVAAFSKAGGLLPQLLAVLAVIPRLDLAAAAALVPAIASMLLIGLYGP